MHLKVADLERALKFYRDLLGFELTTMYGDQTFSDDKSAAELKQAETEREELNKQIGQMKVENEFLKKSCSDAAVEA